MCWIFGLRGGFEAWGDISLGALLGLLVWAVCIVVEGAAIYVGHLVEAACSIRERCDSNLELDSNVELFPGRICQPVLWKLVIRSIVWVEKKFVLVSLVKATSRKTPVVCGLHAKTSRPTPAETTQCG